MQRLTLKSDEIDWNENHYYVTEWLKNEQLLNKIYWKLKDYEDLEERGLLLRLPRYAYFIKDNKVQKGWVQKVVYCVCRKLLLDIRYDDYSLASYRGYVGNNVFLTKEEAEAKLRELEE